MQNTSFAYRDGALHCDAVPLSLLADNCGTPLYVYSRTRLLENYGRITRAFKSLDAHIHYSAKANANLSILEALVNAEAGIDAVSAGEIHRALAAGCAAERIVFAGVGKTPDELRYAVDVGAGWINIENEDEARLIEQLAAESGRDPVRVALRLNPDLQANTHRHIATGHGGAKFGMDAAAVADLLARRSDYPHIDFAGIHVHIGSQLHDTGQTVSAVQAALALMAPYPDMRTVNIGGGLPVAYSPGDSVPSWDAFAEAVGPLVEGYTVLLEPGRSVVADAGVLVTRVLYVKAHGEARFVIVDAGMSDLLRPALYEATHTILPVREEAPVGKRRYMIAGPICETADILGRDVPLADPQSGDLLAVMTAGAYGMVMASNYNARPRPAEVMVENGVEWRVIRQRETWDDLTRLEQLARAARHI